MTNYLTLSFETGIHVEDICLDLSISAETPYKAQSIQ